ncbi:MAG: DegV family protein [Clostridia bacterium]|nr:DegV family protein [Clostridia bacterium]
MKYKIVSDSTANILELEKIPFQSVPIKIFTAEREFLDNENVDIKEMVDYLTTYKGKSGTACPSPDEYLEAYGDADYVFCVTITSTLSGSYNAARLAKEDYESANPGKKVFVVDSLSTGPEMELIIKKILECIDKDMPFEDICHEVTEYKKSTHLLFALETLANLANNGRVSYSVAKVAGILGIRIIGKASNEGTLEIVNKARGEKKTIEALFKNMEGSGYKGGNVIITHWENEKNSTELKELILSKYPNANVVIKLNRALCAFYAEKKGIIIGFEGISKY